MRLSLVAGLAAYCFCVPALAQETEAVVDSKQASTQTAETFEVTMKLNYLLHLPADYKSKADGGDKKWPLLVFLHGAGERGSELNRVKSHGPPKLVENDADFPFVLISPQCPGGGFWNTEHLLQLIQSTIEEHNIDPDRVYLTGLSMGGFGSWALAAEAPEMFAAVAPVCGGGVRGLRASSRTCPSGFSTEMRTASCRFPQANGWWTPSKRLGTSRSNSRFIRTWATIVGPKPTPTKTCILGF